MAKIQVGHFEPDGGLVYLPVGFIPDWFLMCEIGTTNPIIYIWWERQQDDQAANSKEGTKLVGGSSTFDKLADAGGITAYDTGSQLPTVSAWTASTGVTARTATAHGSYVKGRTLSTSLDMDGNKVDREAIFECVTTGTTGSSEPVWPVEYGQNSASDNGVVWQKVDNVELFRGGYEGVCIAAALMTDGQEMYYLAIQADQSKDWGDVVGWTGGILGA